MTLADDTSGNTVTFGECVAFDVIGTNTTFLTTFQVQLNYDDGAFPQVLPDVVWTNTPLIEVIDDTLAHVGISGGFPAGAPCWCFGPGPLTGCQPVPPGPVDLLILDNAGAPFTVQDAFQLQPLIPTALMPGTPASGSLDRNADQEYYESLALNPVLHLVSVIPAGTASWLPILYGYPGPASGAYDGLVSLGGRATIRDFSFFGASWDYAPTVLDSQISGGSGYDFTIELNEAAPVDLTGAAVADIWHDGGGTMDNSVLMDLRQSGVFAYRASIAAAADDYDPSPNAVPGDAQTWPQTCVSDENALNSGVPPYFPIMGRGKDAVYLWDATSAAADQDVLVAVQAEWDGTNLGSGDFQLYVVTDPANNLPAGADGTCVAGADLLGDVATDTVVFSATAGIKYYVIVDMPEFSNTADEYFIVTKTLN